MCIELNLQNVSQNLRQLATEIYQKEKNLAVLTHQFQESKNNIAHNLISYKEAYRLYTDNVSHNNREIDTVNEERILDLRPLTTELLELMEGYKNDKNSWEQKRNDFLQMENKEGAVFTELMVEKENLDKRFDSIAELRSRVDQLNANITEKQNRLEREKNELVESAERLTLEENQIAHHTSELDNLRAKISSEKKIIEELRKQHQNLQSSNISGCHATLFRKTPSSNIETMELTWDYIWNSLKTISTFACLGGIQPACTAIGFVKISELLLVSDSTDIPTPTWEKMLSIGEKLIDEAIPTHITLIKDKIKFIFNLLKIQIDSENNESNSSNKTTMTSSQH